MAEDKREKLSDVISAWREELKENFFEIKMEDIEEKYQALKKAVQGKISDATAEELKEAAKLIDDIQLDIITKFDEAEVGEQSQQDKANIHNLYSNSVLLPLKNSLHTPEAKTAPENNTIADVISQKNMEIMNNFFSKTISVSKQYDDLENAVQPMIKDATYEELNAAVVAMDKLMEGIAAKEIDNADIEQKQRKDYHESLSDLMLKSLKSQLETSAASKAPKTKKIDQLKAKLKESVRKEKKPKVEKEKRGIFKLIEKMKKTKTELDVMILEGASEEEKGKVLDKSSKQIWELSSYVDSQGYEASGEEGQEFFEGSEDEEAKYETKEVLGELDLDETVEESKEKISPELEREYIETEIALKSTKKETEGFLDKIKKLVVKDPANKQKKESILEKGKQLIDKIDARLAKIRQKIPGQSFAEQLYVLTNKLSQESRAKYRGLLEGKIDVLITRADDLDELKDAQKNIKSALETISTGIEKNITEKGENADYTPLEKFRAEQRVETFEKFVNNKLEDRISKVEEEQEAKKEAGDESQYGA